APLSGNRVAILYPKGNSEVDIGTEMQVRTVAQRDVVTIQIGARHVRISRHEMQSRIKRGTYSTGHKSGRDDVAVLGCPTEGLIDVNANAIVAPTGVVDQVVVKGQVHDQPGNRRLAGWRRQDREVDRVTDAPRINPIGYPDGVIARIS